MGLSLASSVFYGLELWAFKEASMTVMKLTEYKSRKAAQVLHCLHALTGDGASDFLVIYRTPDGREDAAFTGVYQDPGRAMLAAAVLTQRLTDAALARRIP